jgi:hypothetical protein
MILKLERIHFGETFTIGKLFNGRDFLCYTIEDKVREIIGKPVAEWKIAGKTAIPKGYYPVTVTMSNRFKRELPLLGNVQGFDGVRIHTGNTSENTEGCLLVGSTWDGRSDFIGGSKLAFDKVFPLIKNSPDPVFIDFH